MNGPRKSDSFVVPEKPPNKGGGAPRPAEGVEGRGLTKGNPGQQNRRRTQSRGSLQSALDRIRQAARRDKRQRFTALWHHVHNVGRLETAYKRLNRIQAPEPQGRGRGRPSDVAAVRGRARGSTRGAFRAAETRGVPSETCETGVHPEE
jgi:hypothetical protein